MKNKTRTDITLFALSFILAASLPLNAITLEESINAALTKNPQVITAQKKVNIAYSKMAQAKGSLLPKISLSAGYGRSYTQPMTVNLPTGLPIPAGSFSLSPDETSKVASYTFSLTQPVFYWGKDLRAISMLEHNYQIAKEDFIKTQNDLTFDVLSAYSNVLKAEKMEAIINERVKNTSTFLNQVNVLSDSGISTYADVLRVKTALANIKQAEISSQNAIRISKLAFNSIIQNNLKAEVKLSEVAFKEDYETVDSDFLISETYKFNPEYQSFLLGEKIASDAVGLAQGGLFPDFTFSASTGRSITEYPIAGTNYDLGSWRAMIAATWNLFDGFANANKIVEARENEAAMVSEEKSIKEAVELRANEAILYLESTKDKIAAAKVAEELAKESLKLAQINYASNIGTSQSVLDSENALHQAETDLWNAKFDMLIAKAKINNVVGREVYKLF